ncbi:MAG: class II glutamine amidotransferase [Planctomycetota bacterium]|jgi:glucosamine--fructose-6-phosphate aminotransferase (isomerizing)
MCGIVGYVGPKQAQSILLESLKRLEYRGYDSAGIAIINNGKNKGSKKTKNNGLGLNVFKDKGSIDNLSSFLMKDKLFGSTGISHTRWATHGQPSKQNAHPHTDCKGEIALVHNGIIENYQEIKDNLIKKKHKILSETDTEVLVRNIKSYPRPIPKF